MVEEDSFVKPKSIVFDPKNADSYKYAVESRFKQMGCLDIARGKRKFEDYESEESNEDDSDLEDRNEVLRAGRNLYVKQSDKGFAFFVDTMDRKMEYINHFKNDCEIGELEKGWNAFWSEIDSKKPGVQSALWNNVFNSAQAPSEDVSVFMDRINGILLKMVDPPPDLVKKGIVVKGVCEEHFDFVRTEALKRDQTWDQFRESVKDHTTQGDAYINLRRKGRTVGDTSNNQKEDEDRSVNAVEGNKKKKWKPNPDIVCFGCQKKGHIKNNCPKLLEKKAKKKSSSKKKKKKKKTSKKRDWGHKAVWKDEDESESSESSSSEDSD
jgi:hypothetical protein